MSCQGGRCDEGDIIWTQECTDTNIQRFVYEDVPGTGGGRLKPYTNESLCWDGNNYTDTGVYFRLRPCNATNMRSQIITGWKPVGKFELYTTDLSGTRKCLSQGHHPKPEEEIYGAICGNARHDNTSFWFVEGAHSHLPPINPKTPPEPFCAPGILLNATETISVGETLQNSNFSVYMEQESNGNLFVRLGTPKDPGTLIWETGVSKKNGTYFTTLQGDSNLITWEGTPPKRGDSIWKSSSSGVTTVNYFFGVDCELSSVSVYEYKPSDPGRKMWTSTTVSSTVTLPSQNATEENSTAVLAALQAVPCNLSAIDYFGYVDTTMEHYGNCGAGPVDAVYIKDEVCIKRGSQCAIAHTNPYEFVEYQFKTVDDELVDIILRLSSDTQTKNVTVLIEGIPGSITLNTPGEGYNIFDDRIWRGVSLPKGTHTLKVSFTSGQTNLCSLSVERSNITKIDNSNMTLLTPFNVSALNYTGYVENTPDNADNCGSGPVEAGYTWDTVCKERGSECFVGWTSANEYLEYNFDSANDELIDVTLRMASVSPTALTYVEIAGLDGGETLYGPGLGWEIFEDLIWRRVWLPAGNYTLKVHFINGGVRLCSLSMSVVTNTASNVTDTTLSVPFDISANAYLGYSDVTDENMGFCGPGPVDAKHINETVCAQRGSDCAISWTSPDEYLEYDFYSAIDQFVDIVLRISSDQSFNLMYVEIKGLDKGQQLLGPGLGWDTFSDSVWKRVQLPAGSHTLRVTFLTGRVNLCAVSVYRAATDLALPFDIGAATNYSGYFENTPEKNFGDCGPGPVDAKHIDETVCSQRGDGCTIGWTLPGEYVEYDFSSTSNQFVDVTFRVASDDGMSKVYVEIDGLEGGEELSGPGLGWDTFSDLVWRRVQLPAGNHTLRITFVTGSVDLCSVSVHRAATNLTVPFDTGAATAYLGYNDSTPEKNYGDCGSGPVDARTLNETICSQRGAYCLVGWTTPGEYLEYNFYAATDEVVDIIFRAASSDNFRSLYVEIDELGVEETLYAPGLGYDNYDDMIWSGVQVPAGNYTLRVTFVTGSIDLCSVSVLKAAMAQSNTSNVTLTVPFDVGATEYSDFWDVDPKNDFDCGPGPVDAKYIDDTVCSHRGAECTIASTRPNEYLTYPFVVADDEVVQISLRAASDEITREIYVEIQELNVGETLYGPGLGWDNFQDLTWKDVELAAGTYTLKVTFVTGRIDLCSLSVSRAATHWTGSGILMRVPFDTGALSFVASSENTPKDYSECGDGKVDAKYIGDSVCIERGGDCAITGTEEDEYLQYAFETESVALVDVTLRIASGHDTSTKIRLEIDDVREATTLEGSGLGWDEYEDLTWSFVMLPAGNHTMTVHFASGGTDLCSVSISRIS